MVQAWTHNIGRVLASARRARADHNTIVVFTSDNGGERFCDTWPFTGKKTELLEGGLRIPAIVRWPGACAPARPEQVHDLDGLAADVAGRRRAAPDSGYPLDGDNLLPVLTGKAALHVAQAVLALPRQGAARRP